MRRMVDDKEMITIDNRITALEQGGGGGVDAYTKAQTDALLLAKLDIYKDFDDDDNPEAYYIKQPQSYGAGIQLQASRDDNHHPDYSNFTVTPTHVIMLANSANHGDNDDDYTGSIEVTDGHVALEVTDGEDTTTLQIGSNSAKINNVQIATMNDIPTVPTTVSSFTNDAGYITSAALTPYVLSTSLATVATTGSYNDLTDKPATPSTAVYKYQHQVSIAFKDGNNHPYFVRATINTDSATKWTTVNALSNFASETLDLASNNEEYIVNGYGYHGVANEVQPIVGMYGNTANIIFAFFMNPDGSVSQVQPMAIGALTCTGCSDNVTKFVTSIN